MNGTLAMHGSALLSTVAAGLVSSLWAATCAVLAGESYGVEIVPQLGHSEAVGAVAVSRDGKTALSAGWDNTVKLWDLTTGSEVRAFSATKPIVAIAYAPDGKNALF